MVQIYHGDGKGKTTAAVGQAVRAAGNGIPVLFAQFLKDDTSGEIAMLQKIGIDTLHAPEMYGFVSRMSEEECAKTRDYFSAMLEYVKSWIEKSVAERDPERKVWAVVILDEILHAVKYGLLDEAMLLQVLSEYRENVEFVLTGRNPSDSILGYADYVTEMKNIKHPYELGISARKGIEF